MINKHSSVAMYEQITSILREEIASQKYAQGGCIGTHAELAKRFQVSLITIRRAMQILEEEGLVVIKQGKGTFVIGQPMRDDLNTLSTLSSMIARNNRTPRVTIRDVRFAATPASLPNSVKSMLGKKCVLVEREHSADHDLIVGYTKLYIPIEFGKFFSTADLEAHSTYELYENKLHVPLGKGVQYIRAGKASDEVAGVLQVESGSPILALERESYAADGRFIEYMEAFYEYSQYILKVELALSAQ